jgi:hypothetical protein
MSSRDINQCVPFLVSRYYELWRRTNNIGLQIALTCTSRLAIEQRALYAQGRELLVTVNHLRDNAGLYLITEKENKIVTWTLDSKHIITDKRPLAEAFDIVIMKGKRAQWDLKVDVNANDIPDWIEVAQIGKEIGLRCGAYFLDKNGKPKPDYPHYETPLI